MATSIYESGYIELIDNTELYITPLKLLYLREFMDAFDYVRNSDNEDEAMIFLLDCMRIAMKQYCPRLMTTYDVEDNLDLNTMYRILELSAGISMSNKETDSIIEKTKDSESSWEKLDLAKLEAEAFLLGIWKDYEELEKSMSMPELVATLDMKRESVYAERKFLAAIQGIDLDEQTGRKEENAWEKMKARVFSGNKTSDPDDVLALQGVNAQKAGFGIGMGLGYERI